MKTTSLAVVSPSPLIVEGLKSIISDMSDVDVDFNELDLTEVNSWLAGRCRAVVIFDTTYCPPSSWEEIIDANGKSAKFISAGMLPVPDALQKKADAAISLLDSRKTIESTLRKYLVTDTADDYPELTMREREIVVGIAKGQSNKEIAEVLHVSVNTVMTHRRNIASKLEIHSPAGLTIYAIVTKLVDITEVQMS